jgi:hypothetical protein
MPAKIQKKLEVNCIKNQQGFYFLDKEKLLFLNSFLEDLL